MSLFAEYKKEREGIDVIEFESKALATYRITGEECYIIDIFVRSPFRKQGLASKLADLITDEAKKVGCKYLTGTVVPSTQGSTESLQVLLAYGFRLHSSQNDVIIFIKEI